MVRKKSVVFRRTFRWNIVIRIPGMMRIDALHESPGENSTNPEAQAAMMQMGPMCPDMSHPSQLFGVVKGPKNLTSYEDDPFSWHLYTLAFSRYGWDQTAYATNSARADVLS